MQIETLKEAIGDEKFAALQGYVSDLIGQRDTARNESINGRKGKQQTIDKQAARIAALEDYVGLEPEAEIDALPPLKQQLDASKQAEAKVKRAERERDEAKAAEKESAGKYRSSQQRAAIADALGGHKFVARDIVESYINQRLVWEGDELMFKADDGKLVGLKDGVAGVARARPELLEPTGAGGAGVRQGNAGGGAKAISEAEFNTKPPTEQARLMAAGYVLTD